MFVGKREAVKLLVENYVLPQNFDNLNMLVKSFVYTFMSYPDI